MIDLIEDLTVIRDDDFTQVTSDYGYEVSVIPLATCDESMEEFTLNLMSVKDMDDSSFVYSDRHSEEPSTDVYLIVEKNQSYKFNDNDVDDLNAQYSRFLNRELEDFMRIRIEDDLL